MMYSGIDLHSNNSVTVMPGTAIRISLLFLLQLRYVGRFGHATRKPHDGQTGDSRRGGAGDRRGI